jgi:hypothetical protein
MQDDGVPHLTRRPEDVGMEAIREDGSRPAKDPIHRSREPCTDRLHGARRSMALAASATELELMDPVTPTHLIGALFWLGFKRQARWKANRSK